MLREIKKGCGYRSIGTGRQLLLCFISAVSLCLSFPNSNFEFLSWFGFIPLFIVLQNEAPPRRKRGGFQSGILERTDSIRSLVLAVFGRESIKAFLLAYVTGIIFWLGTIYWLIHVTGIGLIVLVLYLALYFGVFGLFVSCQLSVISYQLSVLRLLMIPASWVVLEYIRSYLFTGFPWGLLGYSQYLNLPVIQIADITGVWGVSFLVMMVNVAVYLGYGLWVKGKGIKRYYEIFLVPVVLLTLSLAYGFYKLSRTPNPVTLNPIKIAVIQGNIPQELKWDPKAKNFIINKYFELTRQAKEEDPDLIVWPEASFPGFPNEDKELFSRLSRFAEDLQTPLLLGAVTSENNRYYNSALLFLGRDELLGKYNKIHLVPFGEYIPLKMIFGFMENIVSIGDFDPGKSYVVFPLFLSKENKTLGAPFSTLICFEDLFPELSRRFVMNGAGFLVNITNDAWFQESPAPFQHLQASVFRAVENRVFLVRSANTGVSGFISSKGEIIKLVRANSRNIFVDGFASQNMAVSGKKLTFYTRHGDLFVFACIIFLIIGCVSRKKEVS